MKKIVTALTLISFLVTCVALAQEMTRGRGGRYERTAITKTFSLAGIENLSFSSSSYLSGTLTIRSTERSDARIIIRKYFKADSPELAEEFDRYISINFEDLENEFSIAVESKSSPPWSGTDNAAGVDVEIETPRSSGLKIFARTTSFGVEITGPYAAADVSASFGEITIAQITNKINVSAENGGVTIRDCTGPVRVTTSNKPIALINVDGQLGTIRLRNERARIDLESVRGEIDARTDLAQINGQSVRFETGRSTISTENSNIRLQVSAVKGDLTVRNENGKTDLSIPNSASAALLLQVGDGGRIYTERLPIRVDRVNRRLVQGAIGGGDNKIEIDMSGVGTITLEGEAP